MPGTVQVLSGEDLAPANNLADLANHATAFTNLTGLSPGVSATIGLAAGAANTMTITVTVVDANGATVTGVHQLEMWMSENTGGAGLTGDTYSGDLTASTGAILSAHTAKKHWSVATASTGIFVAALVDSAKPADQRVAVKAPVGASVIVSAASGTSWGA